MQPQIKLITLDMDGTVLTSEKTVSARTVTAIHAAQAQGVLIAPATGHPAKGIPAVFMQTGTYPYAITSNGARVVNLTTGETMYEKLISQTLARKALDVLCGYDLVIAALNDGKVYTMPPKGQLAPEPSAAAPAPRAETNRVMVYNMYDFLETQPQGIEKWVATFADEGERAKAWAQMEALGFEVTSSIPHNMELSAPGVTKGEALRQLAAAISLDLAHVMACGDAGNDTEMIAAAGVGVAMANATPEVKAAANYITDTNDADGVAKAIEKFVLGQ